MKLVIVIACGLLLSPGSSGAQTDEGDPQPYVVLESSGLRTAPAPGASVSRVDLIVVGHGDVRVERSYGPGDPMSYDLVDDVVDLLDDGIHRFELRSSYELESGEPLLRRRTGVFEVRGGATVSPASTRGPEDRAEITAPDVTDAGGLQRLASATTFTDDLAVEGDVCVGAVACDDAQSFTTNVGNGDLWITSSGPQLMFRDTTDTGDFAIEVNGGEFGIWDEDATRRVFGIATDASSDSLYLGSGEVGLHTTVPDNAIELQVYSASGDNAEIRLESASSARKWDVESTGTQFWLQDVTAGTVPFRIQNDAPGAAFVIAADGGVGLGTSDPQDGLHLVRTDPSIRFSETDGNQSVFRLTADTVEGSRRFVIQEGNTFQPLISVDQDTGRMGLGDTSLEAAALEIAPRSGDPHLRLAANGGGWTIAGDEGIVTVSREGSGGREVLIRDRLDASGPTLAVDGSVQGTQCVNTSSRTLKTDFSPVDPETVLAKLVGLPITRWRYRHERPDARHLGPVAEDFQALFGLGDGKTISTVDAIGVLMSAVQALQAQNDELKQRLEVLERSSSPSLPE